MNDFSQLVDLASARLGGAAILANDEFFAGKDNLVKPGPPVFIEGKYTNRGKWMDGWETRRRREPGYDWCIIRLGLAGAVRGLVVDTSHFTGNYPEDCSVDAIAADAGVPAAALADASGWFELLRKSPLKGDTANRFAAAGDTRVTHLRLNIFPDGGVARLRAHGLVLPDWERLKTRGELDLIAVEHGGRVIACSDMFFGSRHNLIMPGPPTHMGDGWETRRRRGPGHDWVVVELGAPGQVERLEIDTTHFKGNAPGSCSVDACTLPLPAPEPAPADAAWRRLLAQTPLRPHTRQEFESEVERAGEITHLRLNIFPDGGVSRFRAYGRLAGEGR